MDHDHDEPELEEDGTVLDDNEPVEEPPSEDELKEQYEGEREPEPGVRGHDPDENPDEPIVPDDDDDPVIPPGLQP